MIKMGKCLEISPLVDGVESDPRSFVGVVQPTHILKRLVGSKISITIPYTLECLARFTRIGSFTQTFQYFSPV